MRVSLRPPYDTQPAASAPWQQFLFAPEKDEGAGSRPHTAQPARILIVEDDVLVASQMEDALREAGFEIIGIAATGIEALQIAALHPPTLAILDIRLPGGRDGIDTALELFRSHGVRSIFASAYSDREARERAEPASPLGWLQKPYRMSSLTAMVRHAANQVRRPS
jgi:two-component system, response regulator PdtaR